MSLQISELYVYPIKSMGGIALDTAQLSNTGIAYDRYWMLTDEHGRFLTQREIPELARFRPAWSEEALLVRSDDQQIAVPKTSHSDRMLECTVWGDQVLAYPEDDDINAWFSEILQRKVLLVRRADSAQRYVDGQTTATINFPDSSQYLIIGQASLDDLNSRLEKSLPMNRFRPNIVFTGGQPYEEDNWLSIQVGEINFTATKVCGRCKITTIDQERAIVGTEPLPTLAAYRLEGKKISFGRYLQLQDKPTGTISVGDELIVIR